MQLILMGAEYTGKRALAQRIVEWWQEQTGSSVSFHDHFTPPFDVQDNPTTEVEAENEQLANMVPSLLEKFQRYQIEYHIRPFHDSDLLTINHYYGDAVYAGLYLGYGGSGDYGDRRILARHWDKEMLAVFPAVVLVLMKASAAVVSQRMASDPRPGHPVAEDDLDTVLGRFQEEFDQSLIFRRFELDTSELSGEEVFESFVQQIEPLMDERDSLRILRHRLMMGE